MKQNNTYNGNGQRIEKVENGHVTDYMYQDGTVLFTEDEAGNGTGFNLLGLDSNIIASWRADDEFYFYNRDVKGSSTSILNQDGEAVVSYQYGDFGETQKQGDPSFLNEICYTGGIYDENTGMKLPEKIVVYGSFQSHVGAIRNDSNSETTRMYYIGDNTYTISVVIPFAGTYDFSVATYGTLSATYQMDGYPRSGSANKAYFTTEKDNTVVRFRYRFITNEVTVEMFE